MVMSDNKILDKLKLPAWIFIPIKVIFLLGFFIPIAIWVENIKSSSGTEIDAATDSHVARVSNDDKPLPKPASKPVSTGKMEKAKMEKVNGIDVSHYQGTILWEQVAKDNIRFAFAKATGGVSFVDPEFKNNWHGMRANQIYRGAYHFFYASEDADAQAALYLKTLGDLSDYDFPPVLDVEILDNAQPSVLIEGVITWLDKVEKATGRRPIIYTDSAFGMQYLSDPRLKNYYLWIADYNTSISAIPGPWKDSGWQFWQYSDSGYVTGINGRVDMDYFSGNLDSLKYFIKETASSNAPQQVVNPTNS